MYALVSKHATYLVMPAYKTRWNNKPSDKEISSCVAEYVSINLPDSRIHGRHN